MTLTLSVAMPVRVAIRALLQEFPPCKGCVRVVMVIMIRAVTAIATCDASGELGLGKRIAWQHDRTSRYNIVALIGYN